MSWSPDSYCGGIRTTSDLLDRCYLDEITGCWIWRGARDASGAPSVYCREIKARTSLGVLICVLKTGVRPENGRRWFVTCETPNCANPAHRKEGTASESLKGRIGPRSKVACDRIALSRRKRDPKLNAEIAAEIRASTETSRELANRYGIAQSTASRVKTGKTWRQIEGASVFNWRPQ